MIREIKLVKTWLEVDGFYAKINNGKRNIFVHYDEDLKKYVEYRYIEFKNFTKEFTNRYVKDLNTIKILDEEREDLEERLDWLMYAYENWCY